MVVEKEVNKIGWNFLGLDQEGNMLGLFQSIKITTRRYGIGPLPDRVDERRRL